MTQAPVMRGWIGFLSRRASNAVMLAPPPVASQFQEIPLIFKMFKKNKRVLWLLNHRTLMPYEAPLVRRLGFEVFIPKIVPKYGLRSGAVDYSYDDSLTIPAKILKKLNKFNFYEDEWTPEITKILNRYFSTAFVIPHARLTAEVVENFEGQLIFRAFGLTNESTYTQFLDDLYGPLVLKKMKGLKNRFWFGESYDNLHECEESFFAERSLFLPIGIPDSSFLTARQWVGTQKKILFVCPNAVTDSYYSAIYKNFKRDFGDLPHVIVGAQDVPVDDPCMLGFVSDDELNRLYLECAVLYYHSTEMRHLHYSPVEAAINGMPVVFHKGSLLDRLGDGKTKGRVSSVAEARVLIERILNGERALIAELTDDQQAIARHFSDAYCSATWRQNMDERGFNAALQRTSRIKIAWTEFKRTLLMPWARGRTKIDPHREAISPPSTSLSAERARVELGSSLYDGVHFNHPRFPAAVNYVTGVGPAEAWGRWSNGRKITIVLRHLLEGRFRLFVRAVGYNGNAAIPIPVRIGSETRSLWLLSDPAAVTGSWLEFHLEQPSNLIEIDVPFPTNPGKDTRFIGVGMMEVRAAAPVRLSAAGAVELFGSSLADGIDFSAAAPAFLDLVEGLSENEGWGRWSVGSRIRFELKHVLEGRFRLLLRAVCFGPNIDSGVTVKVGDQYRHVKLPGTLAGNEVSIEFDLDHSSNVIEFEVPHPTATEGDNRKLGIGFIRMRSAPSELP
jgi:hypothetical protein